MTNNIFFTEICLVFLSALRYNEKVKGCIALRARRCFSKNTNQRGVYHMSKTWTVNANGVNHTIEYNKNRMIVDGEKYKLKSANPFIQMIDYSVNFGDVECRLVVLGNKVDLAVNGHYLGSGAPYEPIGNIPVWVSVFAAVSVILGFLLNGWIGLCIGLLLGVFYFNFYLKKKKGTPVVIAFVIATILQFLLGIGVYLLLGSL